MSVRQGIIASWKELCAKNNIARRYYYFFNIFLTNVRLKTEIAATQRGFNFFLIFFFIVKCQKMQ